MNSSKWMALTGVRADYVNANGVQANVTGFALRKKARILLNTV